MNIRSFLTIAIIIWTTLTLNAQSYTNPYKNYSEDTFMDMDFEPNIATPVVGVKEKPAIVKAIARDAAALKNKYTVDLMRDKEVFVVTIPSDKLFAPNDTLLAPKSDALLAGLLQPMREPMNYKILIAIHTDDTGSPTYRQALSTARLNSIYDWFMNRVSAGDISEKLIIIPFSMAALMPLHPNDSRAHRAENRRLEIYFIPGPALIEAAHKHKL